MSPDSETEPCRSGTRSPEWGPHNTADLMIGMCTVSHHHQHGTTVLQHFKIMHVITAHTIHSWPMKLTTVCEWNTYNFHKPGLRENVSNAKCGAIYVSMLENLSKASVQPFTFVVCTFPNSISTISVSALYKCRGQPHIHTLNTNHGNPGVAQFFWC